MNTTSNLAEGMNALHPKPLTPEQLRALTWRLCREAALHRIERDRRRHAR